MALGALEHRDIAEIDWMHERFVGLVTRFAFAFGKRAQIDWMFTIERARQKLGPSYPSPIRQPVQAAA